jgi:hypothetical protein
VRFVVLTSSHHIHGSHRSRKPTAGARRLVSSAKDGSDTKSSAVSTIKPITCGHILLADPGIFAEAIAGNEEGKCGLFKQYV